MGGKFGRHMRQTRYWTICGILPLAMFAGCGSSGPNLATVSGRVTLDGDPVSSAMVMFQPDASGSPSYGATDQDGRYELGYKRGQQGAMIGRHTVRIEAEKVIAGPNGEPMKRPKPVPSRYSTTSELKREVKPGQNVINFELTTK
jgi:hypothetical protein